MKVINEYIQAHKITVNKRYIYEDKFSASRKPKSSNIDDESPFTRRGLNELFNDAKLHKFDCVAVYTHDRLTRNVQESLILKFFFKKLKIEILYCKPGEKLNTQSEKLDIFFENLLNNLSALESNMIGSRTKLGNEYNIHHGFWAGGPSPYGYKLERTNSKSKKSILKISYSEARLVQEIFNLYLQGLSPKKIAGFIKNKYKNNKDRKWTKNSIISILKNEDYTGVLVWDKKGGVRNPVKHKKPITSFKCNDNIIEKEEFELSKNIKAMKRKYPKFFSTPYLLNGYLICGKCGKPMKTKNNGGDRGRVYYCIKEKEKWEACVKSNVIERKVIKALSTMLTLSLINDDNFNTFYDKYKVQFDNRKIINEKASEELQSKTIENKDLLLKCKEEMERLKMQQNYFGNDDYENSSDFTDSLEELYSYLTINNNVLTKRKDEIDKKIKTPILTKEALRNFLLQKKSDLDTLIDNLDDMDTKEIYKISLKFLLYDLIDKIIYNEDKSIEIILK